MLDHYPISASRNSVHYNSWGGFNQPYKWMYYLSFVHKGATRLENSSDEVGYLAVF